MRDPVIVFKDSRKRTVLRAVLMGLCFAGMASCANGLFYDDPIGLFTSVQGKTTMTHATSHNSLAVTLRDEMLHQNILEVGDVIETTPESRAKALLRDDTIISLGDNSRLEITEYLYDAVRDRRSAVLTLARGTVRALIRKSSGGGNSRFEIQTPSAKVIARGTYFAVWLEEGRSNFPPGTTGVVNIGPQGMVSFSSGGGTVIVLPEQFAIALPDTPPSRPAYLADEPLTEAVKAIQVTDIADKPKRTSLSEFVQTPEETLQRVSATRRFSDSLQAAPDHDAFTPPAVLSGAVPDGGPTMSGPSSSPPSGPSPPPGQPPPSPPGGIVPPLPFLR